MKTKTPKGRTRGNDLHRLGLAILKHIADDPWDGLDSKRPLGDSDIEGNVAEAIGLERMSDDEVDADPKAAEEVDNYLAGLYTDWADYAYKTMRRTC